MIVLNTTFDRGKILLWRNCVAARSVNGSYLWIDTFLIEVTESPDEIERLIREEQAAAK